MSFFNVDSPRLNTVHSQNRNNNHPSNFKFKNVWGYSKDQFFLIKINRLLANMEICTSLKSLVLNKLFIYVWIFVQKTTNMWNSNINTNFRSSCLLHEGIVDYLRDTKRIMDYLLFAWWKVFSLYDETCCSFFTRIAEIAVFGPRFKP